MKHFSKHFKLILKTKAIESFTKIERKKKKHETAEHLVFFKLNSGNHVT